MDREKALLALNTILSDGRESKGSIAKKLAIHPSQVSRIAANKFAKLEGNALKVCKFALEAESAVGSEFPAKLANIHNMVLKLHSTHPNLLVALEAFLEALCRDDSL